MSEQASTLDLRRPIVTVPAVTHRAVIETDPEYPTVHWVACSGCSYVQGPCETTEDGDGAWADHLVDLPQPARQPTEWQNVYDHLAFAAGTAVPATWDGQEGEQVVVSLWYGHINGEGEPDGIGVALDTGDQVGSVGLTVDQASALAAQLLDAVAFLS